MYNTDTTFVQERDVIHLRAMAVHKSLLPSQSNELYTHPFYEIIFCRNTCGAEYLVGTRRYSIQEGDVLCIPTGMSHCALIPADMTAPLELDCLWLSQELKNQIGTKFSRDVLMSRPNAMLIRTKGTRLEGIRHCFFYVTEEAKKRDFCWEEMVQGYAYQIAAMVCRAFQDENLPRIESAKAELLDRVMAYIADHIQEKITLASTAQEFFVSESTIKRLFRNQMGISFYRYITQYRLAEAQKKIIQGIPMERIAAEVGFCDYPSFYRAFKQRYGFSPRQYRKQLEEHEP